VKSDTPRLILEFDDVETLQNELETNLVHGGALVPGEASLPERAPCALVLVHPITGRELELPAEVVFVKREGAEAATGLHLCEFGDDVVEALRAFVAEQAVTRRVSVQQQVRSLSVAEQHKLARKGNYAERLALERAFGKSVWEALLHNPRLTKPEVARIARMGTLPNPLIETIATNAAWVSSPEVRRALLGNPRLSGALVDRVLRALPKRELQAVPKQTAYPNAVRNAARRLLPN
jgi:hypothetical protein